MMLSKFITFSVLLIVLLLMSCSGAKTGDLVFTANGEEFIRAGFESKDGWQLFFEQFLVNIVNPTAFIPGQEKKGVCLPGEHWVDLASGGESAPPIPFGEVRGVKAANYQALRFSLERCSAGEYAGYSLVMRGLATRGTLQVPFTILLDEEISWVGLDGYVGESVKGVVPPGGVSEVEMTFHVDHIFGSTSEGEESHVNTGAVGFLYFLKAAGLEPEVPGGVLEVRQAALQATGEYATFIQSLGSLGHLGEGHCEVLSSSSGDGRL